MTDPRRLPRRLHRHGRYGRLPPNSKYVGRGRRARFGNPFVVGTHGTAEECVKQFIAINEHDQAFRALVRRELAGFDLACACPEDAPWCHADVLLRWANG